MKSAIAKSIIKDCLDRGYIMVGDVLYPPAQAAALGLDKSIKKKRSKNLVRTGWIDDERNIRNKGKQRDAFMVFIKQQLGVEVWPEFYFSTQRQYRFDYAIPKYKIAIEQEGGIWTKGNSGHSSGTGIQRDMEKSNLAQSQGWVLIRRTPDQMITTETIEFIRSILKDRLTSQLP